MMSLFVLSLAVKVDSVLVNSRQVGRLALPPPDALPNLLFLLEETETDKVLLFLDLPIDALHVFQASGDALFLPLLCSFRLLDPLVELLDEPGEGETRVYQFGAGIREVPEEFRRVLDRIEGAGLRRGLQGLGHAEEDPDQRQTYRQQHNKTRQPQKMHSKYVYNTSQKAL